ncbi:MAG TPA: diacylglycerol kinase family protein [Solirubrobacteraceae bacterium]|jgi:diacylglycerol kinase family enzyme
MTSRRLWSAAALLLTLAAVVLAVVTAVTSFPDGLSVLACLVLGLGAAWYGLQRREAARVAGITIALLFLAGAIALVILRNRVLENALVIVAVAAALIAARKAFEVHVDLPRKQRPQRPVLFYNPRSGGGKSQRFHLAREARRRGIEPIELRPGDDLERLVRDAVFDGADALAMAGGDGSQAIVAMVAAEAGLPYACIPAGTRNHFALDLGVDRDDVVGALDAFVDGGEREVDLAEVNDRVFVNNVSLGLYADAVQRPGYREAKLHTLLDTVPDVLGPDSKPPALSWDSAGPGESAVAILVSNNPYRLGHALGSGTRPRLDQGELGVAVLGNVSPDGASRRKLATRQWTAAEFEIQAEGPVAAGIDGEAVRLDAPLRFRIRPKALRVRVAPNHPGASPSALEPDKPWEAIRTLARFVMNGGPSELDLVSLDDQPHHALDD